MKRHSNKQLDGPASRRSVKIGRALLARVPRAVPAVTAAAIALTFSPEPAQARVSQKEPIDFRAGGAYGIVHYGDAGSRRYIQIYVHDTRADNRCAEIWADFRTRDKTDHRHMDPVRAIVCGAGRKAWSKRHHVLHQEDGGAVEGISWVDACWRTANRRGCARGIASTNGLVRRGDFDTIPLRGD